MGKFTYEYLLMCMCDTLNSRGVMIIETKENQELVFLDKNEKVLNKEKK